MVGEDSVQQQHDGVVVVEECGNPAGLRQAPRERRRRERGRAAPKERRSRVCMAAQTSSIYRGKGAASPSRVPTPRGGGQP